MHKLTAIAAVCAMAALLAGRLAAGEPDPAAAEPAAAPPVFTPTPSAPGQQDAAPKPFNVEMSAEFMRKVMETSAKIEAIKKQAAERRAEIFKTNTEIQSHQKQMVALQKKINALLAADGELTGLEMERDILLTTMPAMPAARVRAGAPAGLFPMINRAPVTPAVQ